MKKAIMVIVAVAVCAVAGGCTVVSAPGLLVMSAGLKSEQALQGLNVSKGTNGVHEVIIDSASGRQSTESLMQGLIALGALARGVQAPAAEGAK